MIEDVMSEFNQQIKHVTAKAGNLNSRTETQKDMAEGNVELFE